MTLRCDNCGKFRRRIDINGVWGEGYETWNECRICYPRNFIASDVSRVSKNISMACVYFKTLLRISRYTET